MNRPEERAFHSTDDWTRQLPAMSTLAIELYQLAATAPLSRFQRQALESVRAVIAFEGASWEFSVAGGTSTRVHSICSVGDTGLHGECVSTRTSRPHPESGPTGERTDRDAFEKVCFHRSKGTTFDEMERAFLHSLVPLLVDTWRLNRQKAVQGDRRNGAPPIEALAICDGQGWLHASGQAFASLVRTEWPDWDGLHIPPAILRLLATGFVGARVSVTITPVNDLWLLAFRRRTQIDRLTPRERDIARWFGRGLGYREVAEALCISPSTARNHLKNIYDKLEINSKLELAGWLRQIERPVAGTERRSMNQS